MTRFDGIAPAHTDGSKFQPAIATADVLIGWELPFRDTGAGTLGGRFQNLADWAGIPTSRYYQLCFSRASEAEAWRPTWVFREPYYQSMAYRLMVLGGAAALPENNTYVVELRDRVGLNGLHFCEVASRTQFAAADQARAAAQQRSRGFHAVGLTPWLPAFPVPALTGLRQVADFREPAQRVGEPPMVRIFEVTPH